MVVAMGDAGGTCIQRGMQRKPRATRGHSAAILGEHPQARGFALQATQVIQFGAPDTSGADYVDVVHHGSMQREDALDALAEAHFADGDGLADALVIAGDHGSFESLQPFLVAFFDLDVNTDGVARPKLGMSALKIASGDLR